MSCPVVKFLAYSKFRLSSYLLFREKALEGETVNVNATPVIKVLCVMTAPMDILKKTKTIHTHHVSNATCLVSQPVGRRGQRAAMSVRRDGK